VFALLFSVTRLWSIRFPSSTVTSRNGSVNDRNPAVFSVAVLWVARTFRLFSISKPETLPVAVLWSISTSCDCPT
jgi:hypothetical protein